MKVGDLVRRKNQELVAGHMGLVMKVSPYFVWIRWLNDGTIDDCSQTLMEVISEG